MKVSIRDVAKHAGVSIATVSYVLNNSHNVSEATRQRVLSSVKELKYVPNTTSRNSMSGKNNLIGCIVPDITNYYWALVVDSIESTLASHGYNLLITNTKEIPEKEIADLKFMSSGLVDGIIIGSTLVDASVLDECNYTDTPIVFIDRAPQKCIHDSILISNYISMYNGVSNLIERGNTKIGYIAGLSRLSTSIERMSAFTDAMMNHGLKITDNTIKYGDSMYNSAIQPASELLDDNCTALVISNNVMAADVISYIYKRRHELSYPIDVLGYQEGLRDVYIIQPSGVITQPTTEMGHLAAEQIISRLTEPDAPIQNIKLNSSLTLFNI